MKFWDWVIEIKIEIEIGEAISNYFDMCFPADFDEKLIHHQVKYLGLMENLRVRRAGFAYRRNHKIFLDRWCFLNLEFRTLYLTNSFFLYVRLKLTRVYLHEIVLRIFTEFCDTRFWSVFDLFITKELYLFTFSFHQDIRRCALTHGHSGTVCTCIVLSLQE